MIKWIVNGEVEENSTFVKMNAPQSSFISKSNVSFVIPTGQRYVEATCQSFSNSISEKVISTHKISILREYKFLLFCCFFCFFFFFYRISVLRTVFRNMTRLRVLFCQSYSEPAVVRLCFYNIIIVIIILRHVLVKTKRKHIC